MNIYTRIRLQHHLNIVLGFIGLVASLYIIGWVDAEHSGIIGSFSFFLCLATLIGTTINYNSVKSKIEKIKEGDESKS